MNQKFQIDTGRVVHDTLDGEVIAIRNDTGAYYSMAGTAASIWILLGNGIDPETAVSQLCSHHVVSADQERDAIAREVDTFTTRLLDLQLFAPASGDTSGTNPELPAETRGTPWSTPLIEEFNDMADLLLFDPIHEVGPEGWPNRPDDDK